MKQVIVNGQNYLAKELKQGENALEVVDALEIQSKPTRNDVERYMKAQNLDELKTISFGGAGVAFSEVDLDTDIKMAIEVAKLVFAEAERVAVKKLVNSEFSAGLGKM